MRLSFTGLAARLDRNAPLMLWAALAVFLLWAGGDHFVREAVELVAPRAPAHGRAVYERLLEGRHLFAYGASALVSYFAAQSWLFAIDLSLAVLWLLPRPAERRAALLTAWRVVEFLNRQLGHVAAAFLLVIAAANWLQRWP